jgi:hypothetical protein
MSFGTDYSTCQVNVIRLVYLALVGGGTAMPQVDIANLLARHFTSVVSYANHSPSFQLLNTLQKHCL